MITANVGLERQAGALARAQEHWENSHKPHHQTGGGFVVAIAREAGTDASAVGQEVARRLGWPIYDRALIERIAQEMGLRSKLLESVDEKQKSWLMECVEAMTAAGPITEARFVKRLSETLLSLSAMGHCVIVGRGSPFVLPATHTLRVRVVGNRRDRVAEVQRRLNISEAEAIRWVDRTDHERVRFVMEHFYKDPTEPAQYDLVLSTSRWSITECADFIIEALKKMEKHALAQG